MLLNLSRLSALKLEGLKGRSAKESPLTPAGPPRVLDLAFLKPS